MQLKQLRSIIHFIKRIFKKVERYFTFFSRLNIRLNNMFSIQLKF
jgi:hypothetical protein